MLISNKAKGIELLTRSLPYPEQIKNIDLDRENAIFFDWRSQRYKLDLQFCRVERSAGMVLEGDDCSILMTQCLKRELWAIM